MRTSIWRELAISPSTDEREIRRAYARRLKIVHPEDDPEGFQALRAAFEQAMNHARHAAWSAQDWDEDDAVDEGLDAAPPVATDHAASVSTLDQAPQQDPALVAEIERDRAERAEHQRRCDALTEALRHPTPDDEAVLTALVAVFRSSALGALDVHDSTEHWLGQLASQRGPGFGVMLEPTITFFGWDQQPVGHHWNPGLGALQHRYDLETLHRLRNPASPGHEAFMALSRPMGWRLRLDARMKPELGRRIADLLARIDQEVPYVLGYLNADTVAWWRAHLSKPRFGSASFWFVVVATVLTALIAASMAPFGAQGLGLVAGLGVGLAGSILLALAAHYLFVLPRWRIANALSHPGLWSTCGWALAVAVLVLLAAFAPSEASDTVQFALAAGICVVGVILAWWAAVVVDADSWRLRLGWLWTWPPVFLPLWIVSGFGLSNNPALSLALVLMLVLLAIGGVHLARRWPGHGPARLQASGALIALSAVGGGLAFVSPKLWVAAPAAALLFLAGAAGTLAASHQWAVMAHLRRWATPLGMAAIVVAAISMATDHQYRSLAFAWGGAWFGGVLAVTTLGDLVRSTLPARKRRKSADRFA